MAFRTGWKDAFSLHAGERRAVNVLIVLCVLAAGGASYQQWFRPTTTVDLGPHKAQLAAWQTQRDSAKGEVRRLPYTVPDSLFDFDPNHLPLGSWVALGLSRKQAEAIHRYEKAGGGFRVKADVSRMRVVRPELFSAWEPHILLPTELHRKGRSEEFTQRTGVGEKRNTPYVPAVRETQALVELNTADSSSLVALRGIGPSFARGIIGYRERLGGYTDLDQLAEVYILKDKPDAVERIRELVVLDTLMVRRIAINTCEVEELAAHPYVGWKIAKALIAYRQQHGPFTDVSGILGCKLIDPELFRKLAPYLIAP